MVQIASDMICMTANLEIIEKLESYIWKMKLDWSLSLCTKINSKWIEDLNMRYEKINLKIEVINLWILVVKTILWIWIDPKGKGSKDKNKWIGLYKLKSFCIAKETDNKT